MGDQVDAGTTPAGPGDHAQDDLVDLTVCLTGQAFSCLQRASRVTGDSETDVVNRALVMYAAIQDVRFAGGTVSFQSRDGQRHSAVVTHQNPPA